MLLQQLFAEGIEMIGEVAGPDGCEVEIKQVAKYISHCRGGEGVVRDVIEQTLKAQGCWAQGNGFGW